MSNSADHVPIVPYQNHHLLMNVALHCRPLAAALQRVPIRLINFVIMAGASSRQSLKGFCISTGATT